MLPDLVYLMYSTPESSSHSFPASQISTFFPCVPNSFPSILNNLYCILDVLSIQKIDVYAVYSEHPSREVKTQPRDSDKRSPTAQASGL